MARIHYILLILDMRGGYILLWTGLFWQSIFLQVCPRIMAKNALLWTLLSSLVTFISLPSSCNYQSIPRGKFQTTKFMNEYSQDALILPMIISTWTFWSNTLYTMLTICPRFYNIVHNTLISTVDHHNTTWTNAWRHIFINTLIQTQVLDCSSVGPSLEIPRRCGCISPDGEHV